MARYVIGGSVTSIGAVVVLCARDRHGPPGNKSKLDLYLNPPWHLQAGVIGMVTMTELAVSGIISATGRELVVSTDRDIELRKLITEAKANSSPLIVASNHNTYLDAPLLAPMIGKCTTPKTFLWIRDTNAWIFSAASASLLFTKTVMGTIASLVCGLPLQQKWKDRNVPHPEELLALNVSQHIKDLVTCVKSGRVLLYFPEGRLIQNRVEPRDEEVRSACWI
jgi:1-acyl-sn-glycerol-3-phosphate acyltransferase